LQKTRFGVIGAGYGQAVLVPAIRRDSRAEVAAIAATSLEKARRVAAHAGIPYAYGTWEELLDSGRIDALAIAVPPAYQPAIVEAAAARRLPVFLEKPLSLTLSDALRISEVMKAANIVGVVDFNFTGIAAFRAARDAVRTGQIGQLDHVAVNWQVETYANRHRVRNWKTHSGEGGGTLSSFVSHSLHYLEWLTGQTVCALSARLFSIRGDDRPGDTTACLHLEFGSGASASIAASTASPQGSGHEIACYGSDGCVILRNTTSDYMRGFDLVHGTRSDPMPTGIMGPQPAQRDAEDGRIAASAWVVAVLLDAIYGQKDGYDEVGVLSGVRVQQLIDAARESDRTRKWIDVAPSMRATEGACR
jgi:predicted dehydrogenase